MPRKRRAKVPSATWPSKSGQGRTDAGVRAKPEAQVTVLVPADVKNLRMAELFFVVVGRGRQCDQSIRGVYGPAGKLDVIEHNTADDVHRRVETQYLFYGAAISEGSARSRSNWSGWRAKASTPLAIRLTVVSCPATRRR